MDRITDSNIKETIRRCNEDEAIYREEEIDTWVDDRIADVQSSDDYIEPLFVILTVLSGFLFFILGGYGALIMAVIINATIYFIFKVLVKREIEKQERRIRATGQDRIRESYIEADRKTHQEIAVYENEVERNTQMILENPEIIQNMTDHMIEMFQRMVSHVDAGTNVRFIETDFIYEVRKTGIIFYYPSDYTNPMDDYNFDKKRYRDLNTDAECEGLAQALAILAIQKMAELYTSKSLKITSDHNDAFFTLHFHVNNEKYITKKGVFENEYDRN